jgi:hypothetical protein
MAGAAPEPQPHRERRSETINVVGEDWGTIRVGAQMTGSGGLGFMQDELRVGTALSDSPSTSIPRYSTA